MDRERQEPPRQPRGLPGPQNPAGWQMRPGVPPGQPSMPPSQQVPLAPKPYSPNQPNVPPPYPEPVADMGTTLGYAQGTEYQYFQPSQPLPKLTVQERRLQQLSQERLQRGGQYARPDGTPSVRGRK